MQKEKMFQDSGKWYKGNLHAHTVYSDGKLTPEQVIQMYKQHGYSFMCLSEHDFFTDWSNEYNSEKFILLPGLEGSVCLIDAKGLEDVIDKAARAKGYVDITRAELMEAFSKVKNISMKKTHHIHGILGNEEMQQAAGIRCFKENEYTPIRVYFDEWDGKKAAQDLTDYLRDRGCFTTYNHPIWSRVDCEEVKELHGIWAMEIYNYATVNECGEGSDTVFWDAMLRGGKNIMAFASDDNHNGGMYPESFGGYIMVQAEELTHENIVNSMLEGRYYSSNGAEIYQWGIKDGEVYVECKEAKRVNFIFGGSVGASKTIVAENNIFLTDVHCPLRGNESYVRIEVEDMHNQKAWTNPIFLDSFTCD